MEASAACLVVAGLLGVVVAVHAQRDLGAEQPIDLVVLPVGVKLRLVDHAGHAATVTEVRVVCDAFRSILDRPVLLLLDEQGAELVLGEGEDRESDRFLSGVDQLQDPAHRVFVRAEPDLHLCVAHLVHPVAVERLLGVAELAAEHLVELEIEPGRHGRGVDQDEVVRVVPQVGVGPVGGAGEHEAVVHHHELVVHDVVHVAGDERDVAFQEPLVAAVVQVAGIAHHPDLHAAVVRADERVDHRLAPEAHHGEVDRGGGAVDELDHRLDDVGLPHVGGAGAGLVEVRLDPATTGAGQIFRRGGAAGEQEQGKQKTHQRAPASARTSM